MKPDASAGLHRD